MNMTFGHQYAEVVASIYNSSGSCCLATCTPDGTCKNYALNYWRQNTRQFYNTADQSENISLITLVVQDYLVFSSAVHLNHLAPNSKRSCPAI